MLTLALSNAR